MGISVSVVQIFYSDELRTSTVVEETDNGKLYRTDGRIDTLALSQIPPEQRERLINTDAAFFLDAAAVRTPPALFLLIMNCRLHVVGIWACDWNLDLAYGGLLCKCQGHCRPAYSIWGLDLDACIIYFSVVCVMGENLTFHIIMCRTQLIRGTCLSSRSCQGTRLRASQAASAAQSLVPSWLPPLCSLYWGRCWLCTCSAGASRAAAAPTHPTCNAPPSNTAPTCSATAVMRCACPPAPPPVNRFFAEVSSLWTVLFSNQGRCIPWLTCVGVCRMGHPTCPHPGE